ncbi:AIM24 family protein [Nocardia sp. NPDC057030]|uniref:AIM24 family protein n=1 Tax=unclassified Nocardia TaxID=2637762 RepID=UPI00363409EF
MFRAVPISVRRSVLAGESFLVSTFTAPRPGGWVDVAPALPGHMLNLQITWDRTGGGDSRRTHTAAGRHARSVPDL